MKVLLAIVVVFLSLCKVYAEPITPIELPLTVTCYFDAYLNDQTYGSAYPNSRVPFWKFNLQATEVTELLSHKIYKGHINRKRSFVNNEFVMEIDVDLSLDEKLLEELNANRNHAAVTNSYIFSRVAKNTTIGIAIHKNRAGQIENITASKGKASQYVYIGQSLLQKYSPDNVKLDEKSHMAFDCFLAIQ